MQVSMRQEYLRMRLQAGMPDQRLVCVDPEAITLHENALSLLRQAAAQVAAEAHVTPGVIHDRLFQYVFRLEPSGSLLLVLAVPERDVEMNVELPSGLWKEIPPPGGRDREEA